MVPMVVRRLPVAALIVGCTPTEQDCEEDPRAAEPGEIIELDVAGESLSAEVASSPDDSPWAFRRCGLDAFVVGGEVRVTLCNVQTLVDVALVSGTMVTTVETDVAPCREPCDECTDLAAGSAAEFAVVTLAGRTDVHEGHVVFGLENVP